MCCAHTGRICTASTMVSLAATEVITTASSPDIRWYFANNPSPAVPNGFGDEDPIRAVWAAVSPKP